MSEARTAAPSSGVPPTTGAGLGAGLPRPQRKLARPRHPIVAALRRVARHRLGLLGAVILLVLVVVAIAAPWLSPFNPLDQHPGAELARPGSPYLLGTDQLGRDLFSRILYGSRNSFLIGVVAVALGAGIGIATGLLAGFLGGWVDAVIMRCYDALLAFRPSCWGWPSSPSWVPAPSAWPTRSPSLRCRTSPG